MSADLEQLFPRLSDDGYVVSSPERTADNCIAWSVGESDRWWQPKIDWPAQPGDDLAALIALFASLGYEPSDHRPCGVIPASGGDRKKATRTDPPVNN